MRVCKAQDDELGEIEKAVYADTPQNRKLGRVGQEYHRGKGKKEDESENLKRNGLRKLLKNNDNDSSEYRNLQKEYGVNLSKLNDGAVICKILYKKEVGGLKRFLKNFGITYNQENLKRVKGFHGTHSYVYDISDITGVKDIYFNSQSED